MTNLLGPMNVTRAVLPVMRRQRSGHVIAISSGAGLMGFEYSSVYAASKFGLEGWMTALDQEVAPFGISTTIVNPGFFRTELGQSGVVDLAGTVDRRLRRAQRRRNAAGGRRRMGNSPAIPTSSRGRSSTIANEKPPPRRFLAGADVIALAERKIADLQAQIESHRALSESLTFDRLTCTEDHT